tara:strand:- start:2625 stop:4064 length:1440 start_codon:yes stop_codon:yes gene_type:complete
MLFNSIEFFIFLSAVFFIYWIILKENLKSQNVLLLISSYLFYSWWDWRFLSLILISTLVDYLTGKKIFENHDKLIRKAYLLASIIFNLGLLAFFKYFNFFIESWIILLDSIGYQQKSLWSLNIILPLGISFYTFQTMSYSLDIYNKKIKPVENFITFAVFVSFFPQLVAGPIERASNLIPQIQSNRYFKYKKGVKGLRLILWGLFKKVAIADRLAIYVNIIFNDYTSLNGGVLFLGLVYFTIQIYCDFSGYSDIAIGTAKLLGFDLKANFNFPLFAKNPVEFWKKWHISLTSWIRDYIYWPMALKTARKKSHYYRQYLNNIYIWILTGLWHGANYTFLFWGFYWGIVLFIYSIMRDKFSQKDLIIGKNRMSTIINLYKTFFMFLITGVSLIIFRSQTVDDSIQYLIRMFTNFGLPQSNRLGIFPILFFIVFEWLMKKDVLNPLSFDNIYIRYSVYIMLIIVITCFSGNSDSIEFIYFQF